MRTKKARDYIRIVGSEKKETWRSEQVQRYLHFLTKYWKEFSFDDISIIPQIHRLNYSDLLPLFFYFEYKQTDIAQLLDVDASTISRWKNTNKEMDIYRTKAIVELDKLIASGVKIFGSEEAFKEWLETSNYALGGKKPMDIIKLGPYGIEKVEDALEGMMWGHVL